MAIDDWAVLSDAVHRLLQKHAELKQRYDELKHTEAAWLEERTQLISKNEVARQKVELMISRLKALEQEA